MSRVYSRPSAPRRATACSATSAMAARNELMQAIDYDILHAEHEDFAPASQLDLRDLLGFSREARRRLDEDLVLRQHPVTAFLAKAELGE